MQRIVGIDCAVAYRKVGLALGELNDTELKVLEVTQASKKSPPTAVIHRWLKHHSALLAFDAPLGWPQSMANALSSHRAGEAICEDALQMFRRETDRVVKQITGKQPLDVGANLIARTAHAALSLLKDLRNRTNQPIPIAWKAATAEHTEAIEVYPAGTLAARKMTHSAYKGHKHRETRRSMLRKLRTKMRMDKEQFLACEKNDDLLDASLCVLAARDFLLGKSLRPYNLELAKKEGWIWILHPEHQPPDDGCDPGY